MAFDIKILEEFKIYPKLLKDIPEKSIIIKYPDGDQVDFGNELTPSAVKFFPYLEYECEKNQLYTLLMIDLGAIHANTTSVLHWLVVNITGNNVGLGDTRVEYLNPAPSRMGGYRRYLFLIYEQKNKSDPGIGFISKIVIDGRLGFNLNEYIEKNSLDKPYAINFFVAKWDQFAGVVLKSWPSLDHS